MLKYYYEMLKRFGEINATKILLLVIGVRFYPILSAVKLRLHAPIGVIVNSEEVIGWIVSELCGFAEPKIISLSEKLGDFKKNVNMSEYELLAVFCKNMNERNRENLSYLNDLMISKHSGNKAFCRLPIIFFVNGIPSELSDLLAGKIVVEGKVKGGEAECPYEVTHILIDSFCRCWTAIQGKLGAILCGNFQESFFLAACKEISLFLLNDEVKEEEEHHMIRRFGWRADTAKDGWLIMSNYSEWIEHLRELIVEEGKKFAASADRMKEFTGNCATTLNILFFDKNYYYITESMFGMACIKLGCYVSKCEMKQALTEAGILIGEGRSRQYYSVKIPISTSNGIRVFERRMRIIREWIDRPGELAWYEQIEMRRKEGDLHD